MDLEAFPRITDADSATFEAVTSGQYGNFALLSCQLDGDPVTVVCALVSAGGTVDVHPLYIAVTDALFGRLTPPIEPEEVPA